MIRAFGCMAGVEVSDGTGAARREGMEPGRRFTTVKPSGFSPERDPPEVPDLAHDQASYAVLSFMPAHFRDV